MCPNLHILLLLFIALNPQNIHHWVGLESPSRFDSSFVKATYLNRIRLWDRNSADLFFPSGSSGFPFSTPLAWDRAPQRDSEKVKKPLTGSNKAVVWGGERAQTSSLFSPNAEPGSGLQLLMFRIFHVLVKSISAAQTYKVILLNPRNR